MKKFLSIILTLALMLSLTVSPAVAITADDLKNATGDNWETFYSINLADYSGTFTYGGLSSTSGYKDPATGLQYPDLTNPHANVKSSKIASEYPHLANNAMNEQYVKWERTAASYMLRINKISGLTLPAEGTKIKVTLEICITDIVPGVAPIGSTPVPVDNKCVDFIKTNFAITPGSGNGSGTQVDVPVNKWTTINAYYTLTKDTAAYNSIKIDQGVQSGTLAMVTTTFPKTAFMGKLTFQKLIDSTSVMESEINNTEDFERYYDSPKKYTADGSDVTNKDAKNKYHQLTSIHNADKAILGEDFITCKDSRNPNNTQKYSKSAAGTVYPTSGSILGKYHLYGDSALGDTGVSQASFGIGYGNSTVYSTNEHLSAADRLKSGTASRSLLKLPAANSGKHMLVASGLYNKNGSVRMHNLFGSHPTANDIGRKFIISYYVYADSNMGAYKAGTGDYASAVAEEVNKTKPIKLTTSFNGPLGNIYKYSTSYMDTAVATSEIPWDTWTKVSVLCEITADCIDNGVIEAFSNPTRNSLQVSQCEATNQIADTLYFDDLSVREIPRKLEAKYAIYEMDGLYDVAVKILSVEEDEESTVAPTVKLIVGEYDINGLLVSIRTTQDKTIDASQLPIALSIPNIKPINPTNTLKAFLIDSYTGLCPYISPVNDLALIADRIE